MESFLRTPYFLHETRSIWLNKTWHITPCIINYRKQWRWSFDNVDILSCKNKQRLDLFTRDTTSFKACEHLHLFASKRLFFKRRCSFSRNGALCSAYCAVQRIVVWVRFLCSKECCSICTRKTWYFEGSHSILCTDTTSLRKHRTEYCSLWIKHIYVVRTERCKFVLNPAFL